MRVTRLKMFIGSTIEEIEKSFNDFFGDNLCPGNVITTNLQKHGGVYQYQIIYAEFIPDQVDDIIGECNCDGSCGDECSCQHEENMDDLLETLDDILKAELVTELDNLGLEYTLTGKSEGDDFIEQ